MYDFICLYYSITSLLSISSHWKDARDLGAILTQAINLSVPLWKLMFVILFISLFKLNGGHKHKHNYASFPIFSCL